MSGTWWAILAGVGFGLFQTVNRRALDGMDVYLATFLQLLVSALVLIVISLATQDMRLLLTASPSALINFALGGFVHFFVGWTFMNASQKRIGAARTSPLIGTTPLFAAIIAAFTLSEFPDLLSWVAMGLIVAGVYLTSKQPENPGTDQKAQRTGLWQSSWPGLSAALCWAISPIFIRFGLQDLPSPLFGVTVGLTASALGYGLVLLWQRQRGSGNATSGEALFFKLVAGLLVGLSTWARWIALDLAPVAIVLALTMVSTPVVIVLSPLVSGRHIERITPELWLGAGMVIGGALMLTLVP